MFKNLKQKTLNNSSAGDSSLLSSRSISSNSLNNDNPDTLHQSVDSLNSDPPVSQTTSHFGNLQDIISDLRAEIEKKDAENKKLHKYSREAERRINELVENWTKEVEGRNSLERAYDKLEDNHQIELSNVREKAEQERLHACNQLQNQVDRLKKDNEKLGKKGGGGDAVAWQNKAESLEVAYNELLELQEHSEVQVQKMKDLIKMKDVELQALENKFVETEERFKQQSILTATEGNETTQKPHPDVEVLTWKVAKAEQEVEDLEKQVVKLEIELEETTQKSADKDFRVNRLREDIKNKDLVIETQRADALELQNALDRTSNMLNETKSEFEATRSSYTKSLSDLQSEIDSITEQYKECKTESRRQTDLVEQLQIAASATKTLKVNLQEDLSSWKTKYEEGRSECLQLYTAQTEYQGEIERLQGELAVRESLAGELAALKEEVLALQQTEEELRLEKEYLTVARESWNSERAELEESYSRHTDTLNEKLRGAKEEIGLLRRSNQPTILPVSSNLQAKFVKGVTEVDVTGVRSDDAAELRSKVAELEKELGSKTKQLKQQQQHLADLKKTIQSELRGGAPPSSQRGSPASGRKEPSPDQNQHNLGEDVNSEYLKHCVIKFMCSLDNETSYLVRVIGVLLNFTKEETSIVNDALQYKQSWFKQVPPKSLRKLKSTRGSPPKK